MYSHLSILLEVLQIILAFNFLSFFTVWKMCNFPLNILSKNIITSEKSILNLTVSESKFHVFPHCGLDHLAFTIVRKCQSKERNVIDHKLMLLERKVVEIAHN